MAAGNVSVEWRFIARSGFPPLSLHVLRAGSGVGGEACFTRDLPPGVAKAPSLDEEDSVSPANTSEVPSLDFSHTGAFEPPKRRLH